MSTSETDLQHALVLRRDECVERFQASIGRHCGRVVLNERRALEASPRSDLPMKSPRATRLRWREPESQAENRPEPSSQPRVPTRLGHRGLELIQLLSPFNSRRIEPSMPEMPSRICLPDHLSGHVFPNLSKETLPIGFASKSLSSNQSLGPRRAYQDLPTDRVRQHSSHFFVSSYRAQAIGGKFF